MLSVYIIIIIVYAHHELRGSEDPIIWLFHTKDLLNLTGAGNKVLRVALGVAFGTSVILKTRLGGHDSRRVHAGRGHVIMCKADGSLEGHSVGGRGPFIVVRSQEETKR